MLTFDDLITDYGDPLAEARRCRRQCALFDFSFVYRLRLSGPAVVPVIEAFQPRKIGDMSIGQIRYSVKSDPGDRVRSDLTIWRFDDQVFEIMTGCEADVVELLAMESEDLRLVDLSEGNAILSVQGPHTVSRLARIMDVSVLRELDYFRFGWFEIDGLSCLVGRLGYSGEAGFEILVELEQKSRIWNLLSNVAAPAGFAAIDILRIEAGFFLFTHECRVRPRTGELGLSKLIPDENLAGPRKLVTFTAQPRPLEEMICWQASSCHEGLPGAGEIQVTSACFSPHLDTVLGLGFVLHENNHSRLLATDGVFEDIELCESTPLDPQKQRPGRAWPLPKAEAISR